MKRASWGALALLLAWNGLAAASDPIGIYALVDKVVMEPSETKPERIQIWGVFSLAGGTKGDRYLPPVRGYLYCKLAKDKEAQCRTEWADLSKTAGSGQCVGMGSRYDMKVTVRKPVEGAQPGEVDKNKPDVYPLGFGLERVRRDNNYAPIKALYQLPAPVAPGEGSLVPAGKVTLTTRNIQDKSRARAKYVFEIGAQDGAKEVSTPIAAGEKETKWSPRMEVKAGRKYTWRVWAVEGQWKGPAAATDFKGK